MDEGYIKFNCDWNLTAPWHEEAMDAINQCRSILYEEGWIGIYDNGIGFGNISVRTAIPFFIITGNATGGCKSLTDMHFSRVTAYNLSQNEIGCNGPIKASSESLTHAAIYECAPHTNAVIHIHSKKMWQWLLHRVPTTDAKVPYGTPAMAHEIKRLFAQTSVRQQKIIVMEGHEEGIITFGETLQEACNILMHHK